MLPSSRASVASSRRSPQEFLPGNGHILSHSEPNSSDISGRGRFAAAQLGGRSPFVVH